MRREELCHNQIFLIHDLLSSEECEHYRQISEELGFADAPITTGAGFVVEKSIRNNTRVMIDDHALAAQLWDRAADHVPSQWGYRRAVGLNERFRFYRYEPGQRFARHADGAFDRNDSERSEFSFLIYLNDGFTGGETVFRRPSIRVQPSAGMALVFVHHLLHEGAEVETGTKYVMRSDVMYSL